MDTGSRTLSRFEYSLRTKWMLDPAHFRDDKMGDGLCTLFHFERFAIMAPVHFFVLGISRRRNGRWSLYTFPFGMIHSDKSSSLYTVKKPHTHTQRYVTRRIFLGDKMDFGPRTLSRWQNVRWSSYTFSFRTFRDDGPRALFRSGNFTMTKWTMVSVHFFILNVSRWQKSPPKHFTTATNTHYGTEPKNICVFLW